MKNPDSISAPAPSRWGPFTTGIALGVAASLLGIGMAVAAQRRRLRKAEAELYESGEGGWSAHPHEHDEAWQSERLDEELDQTFPASDPLPHSHRVD